MDMYMYMGMEAEAEANFALHEVKGANEVIDLGRRRLGQSGPGSVSILVNIGLAINLFIINYTPKDCHTYSTDKRFTINPLIIRSYPTPLSQGSRHQPTAGGHELHLGPVH